MTDRQYLRALDLFRAGYDIDHARAIATSEHQALESSEAIPFTSGGSSISQPPAGPTVAGAPIRLVGFDRGRL